MTTGARHDGDRSALGRAGSAVGRGLHAALGLVLLAVVAVNVANAAGRYLLGVSVTGTDELMVYAMIWVVMLGAVLSLAGRQHIGIELLPAAVGPRARARAALYLVHDAVALAVCAYLARASWLFVTRISGLGTTSMGLGIPMSWPHAALLVGFAGMAVVAAGLIVADLRRLLAGGGR
jgi:TRAP-type C4-dicarboxylate transport system permease small subunit